MKQLIIMRGLPGSGKSTFVSRWFKNAAICSADHFFTNPVTGEYQFDRLKLSTAHMECYHKCINLMQHSHPVIVIDNTNSKLYEYEKYLSAADVYGYSIAIIELQCDIGTAFSRCIHNVPKEKIIEMSNRWQ